MNDYRVMCGVLAGWCLTVVGWANDAPDLATLQRLHRSGQYESCIELAQQAIDRRLFGEEWYLLKLSAEQALGRHDEAWQTVQAGLQRYDWSIRLREAGLPIARATDHEDQVPLWLQEISSLAARSAWRYTDADNLVALGRVALLAGADAREVLEQLFDRALRLNPQHQAARISSGGLALSKQDYALAAEIFREAIDQQPDDPEAHYGLARALEFSDPQRAAGAIARALEINPRHVPSIIFRAEQALDAEQYDLADQFLRQALEIDPRHPEAWAYRAVIAALTGQPEQATKCRAQALSTWKRNPRVDYLIGRKLSQKYRFAEGAAHQQLALQFDPKYLPARTQLVQDWLRLGLEEPAWKLAEEVHREDGYDVHIFNLLELKDKLDQFETLERNWLRVRMTPQEAAIYGDDVLDLLEHAARVLGSKYGWTPQGPVIVEIYPDPQDFAVRTFGMPGVSGYLGVCFGAVVTANSPASQAEAPANWQAVLWHEFCHVVTLQVTQQRMPRWLSEGISVYEERQAHPTWGQRMTPRYREWILTGRLLPIAEMSAAFLSPPTPAHLSFAYYQASLVVEHLIQQYGLSALQAVLHDLAQGVSCEDALERHCAPLAQLDAELQEYARELARRFGPDLDWDKHDLSALIHNDDLQPLETWVRDHPRSVVGLTALAEAYIEAHRYDAARRLLEQLVAGVPEYAGPGSGYELLAAVLKTQGDVPAERAILRQWVSYADEAVGPLLRLIQLDRQAGDWPSVLAAAQQLLAINPLLPEAQLAAGEAAWELRDWPRARKAWRALLALNPDDRADVFYRLAMCAFQLGDWTTARHHVLAALELAPRYRAALHLLWIMHQADQRPVDALLPANTIETCSPWSYPLLPPVAPISGANP
ncbi:MAG: hypothetical protein KatS3mg114_1159 [Planctomycetaceae bacterium]|nr:MAG: hypothetical protein KatS3mg114_1159 [Planctomycetaceae bacterium]